MKPVTALRRAASIVGNPTALANKIGRRQSTVWDWLSRGWPAAEACQAIEKATEGKITRHDLRPDVFGEPPVKQSGAA